MFVDLGAKLRITNNVITKDDPKLPAEVYITGRGRMLPGIEKRHWKHNA